MNNLEFRLNLVHAYLEKVNLEKKLLDFYSGKSILITGGAGGIGSNLLIALSILVGPAGRITVLDNLSSIKGSDAWNVSSLDNVQFVYGDIRNDIDLKRVFKNNPKLVFH